MPGRSIRVGTLAGIPIGINPLWILIVVLITWALGDAYYPEEVPGIEPAAAYALGLASALLLFASIVLHELGHAIVARRRGIGIEGIDLWLLGGVAKLEESPHEADDELRYAVAGPAVTAVIVALLALVQILLPSGAPEALEALVTYQLTVNALILGFNMIPAFPLDGGRVLRAALWKRSRTLEGATATAAAIGRGFAYFLIAAGVLAALSGAPGGFWFVLIGLFLIFAGRAEEEHLRERKVFSGHRVAELASFPAVTIPADLSAAAAGRDYFARHRFRAFPVIEEAGAIVGLLAIDRLEAVFPEQLEQLTAGALADPDPALVVDSGTDLAELLETASFRRSGRAIVTDPERGIGMVSMTEIERALRASRLAGGRLVSGAAGA